MLTARTTLSVQTSVPLLRQLLRASQERQAAAAELDANNPRLTRLSATPR